MKDKQGHVETVCMCSNIHLITAVFHHLINIHILLPHPRCPSTLSPFFFLAHWSFSPPSIHPSHFALRLSFLSKTKDWKPRRPHLLISAQDNCSFFSLSHLFPPPLLTHSFFALSYSCRLSSTSLSSLSFPLSSWLHPSLPSHLLSSPVYNVIAEVYSVCEHSIAALADESSWDLATVARWEFGGILAVTGRDREGVRRRRRMCFHRIFSLRVHYVFVFLNA